MWVGINKHCWHSYILQYAQLVSVSRNGVYGDSGVSEGKGGPGGVSCCGDQLIYCFLIIV